MFVLQFFTNNEIISVPDNTEILPHIIQLPEEHTVWNKETFLYGIAAKVHPKSEVKRRKSSYSIQ